MSAIIKCQGIGCEARIELADDKFARFDDNGDSLLTVHNRNDTFCVACKLKHDAEEAMVASEYAIEKRREDLRRRAEELVADFNAPRRMVDDIVNLAERHAGHED